MNTEAYLNHPTFGMLFRICELGDQEELFTTLYAQRLFLLVSHQGSALTFEPITRTDARMKVEMRLRQLRQLGSSSSADYQALQTLYKRTFQ